MANGSTRYIIQYVGDISDVLRKIRILQRETASLGRGAGKNLAPLASSLRALQEPLDNTAQSANRSSTSIAGLISRAVKVIPVWFALRAVFTAFITTLQNGIKFLVDWEFQLATIRVVGDATEGQIRTLSQGLLNLQKTLGISTKDIGEGAKLFRQQGRAIEEIIPLLDATAKLSLITGKTITESVEDITAVLKAFNIESSQAITIVDKLTNVELQNAISANDLTSALRQSASTAAQFGITLDELIGLITAIQVQTRDTGNVVGRALRTVFIRLGTTAVETSQQIAKVPFFLDELGNVTTQRTPKLRNLTAIITELAASFNGLESAQRAQLLKSVAGLRQANQVSALFNNFNDFIKAQQQAQFGLGQADRAIGILTQTTASKIVQVDGAWKQFLDTVADTSAFRTALDAVKNLIEGTTALTAPDAAFSTGLIAELGKQVQSLTRQGGGIQSIFQEIESLRDLNESIGRNPNDDVLLGISLTRVQEFRNAIREFERVNRIDLQLTGLDDITTTTELLSLLESQSGRLSDEFIDITIRTNIAQAQQEIQSAREQVRRDFENLLPDGNFFANLTSPGQAITSLRRTFSPLKEIIKDLSSPTDFQRAVQNIDEIKASLSGLGLTDEDIKNVSAGLDALVSATQRLTSAEGQDRDAIREKLTAQQEITNEAIVEGEVKRRLLEIELEGIKNQNDALTINEKKLELLNKQEVELSAEQLALIDTLSIERERLLAAEELAVVKQKENLIIAELKRNGASQLQIELQKLAFLRAQNRESSPEVVEQIGKIKELSLQREQELTKGLFDLTKDILALNGATNAEISRAQIDLQNRLGIEVDTIDALKQQLDILKQLKSEQEELSREDRLRKLSQAIAQARAGGGLGEFNRGIQLDFNENRLRQQAGLAGLSEEQISNILGDNLDAQIAETERNIQALLGNTDSVNSLASSIEFLTQRLLAQESRLSAEQVARATVGAQVAGPANLRNTQTQPFIQQPLGVLPNVTSGFRVPAAGGGNVVQISIGDTQVVLNQNATDKQLQDFVRSALNEDNDRRIREIANRIAQELRTPGTSLNQADQENLNNF